MRKEEVIPDEDAGMETAAGDAAAAEVEGATEETAPEHWQREWQALNDQHLRLAAEFENFRKRTAREALERARMSQADLLSDLLEIADNFERALSAEHDDSPYARGVALIREQLEALLARRGVQRMEALGKKFDPEFHEALLQQASEVAPGHVCRDLRSGYLLHGKTLRAAQVAVSTGPEPGADAPKDEPTGEVKE